MVEQMQIEINPTPNTKNNIIEDLINSIDSDNSYIALNAANHLKNKIIGSDRKKAIVIYLGIFEKLHNVLIRHNDLHGINIDSTNLNYTHCDYVRVEIVALQILTSLAKISNSAYIKNVKAFFTLDVQNHLINYLTSNNDIIVETSLCCLRALAVKGLLQYEKLLQPNILNAIIQNNIQYQKCNEPLITILATVEINMLIKHFDTIASSGLLKHLFQTLIDDKFKIKVKEDVLTLLIKMTSVNKPQQISHLIAHTCEISTLDPLSMFDQLQQSNQPLLIQLKAAICVSNVFKATILSGATYDNFVPTIEIIDSYNSLENMIIHRTLPTLVRMSLPDKALEVRTQSILALAKLIDLHPDLQTLASQSYQLLNVVGELINNKQLADNYGELQVRNVKTSVLQLYAALTSNHECIRKKLVDSHNLIDHVLKGLKDTDQNIKYAATLCLLSLTRSVQLLRTSFQEESIWTYLLQILRSSSHCIETTKVTPEQEQSASSTPEGLGHNFNLNVNFSVESTGYDLLNACLATLANLLLEFSPAKEMLVNQACILADLAKFIKNNGRQDTPFLNLKLNALWCLMNMMFRAEESLKRELLAALCFDTYVLPLIRDAEKNGQHCGQATFYVRNLKLEMGLKALGLLRNVCSPKPHLTTLLPPTLGENILQELVRVMSSLTAAPELKEQAICVASSLAQSAASDAQDPTSCLLASEGLGYAVANNLTLESVIGDEREERRTLENLIACAKEMAAAAAASAFKESAFQAPERVLRSAAAKNNNALDCSPLAIRKVLAEKLKYNLALREDILKALVMCTLKGGDSVPINSLDGEPVFKPLDPETGVQDVEMHLAPTPSSEIGVGGIDQTGSGFATPEGGCSSVSPSEDSENSSDVNKRTTSGSVGLSYTVSILAQQKVSSGENDGKNSLEISGENSKEPDTGTGPGNEDPEFSIVQRAAMRCLNFIYAPKCLQKINTAIAALTGGEEREENKRATSIQQDSLRSLHWKILSQVLDSLPSKDKAAFLGILQNQLFPTDLAEENSGKSSSNPNTGAGSDILLDSDKESLKNLLSFLTWRKGQQRSKRNYKSFKASTTVRDNKGSAS